MGHSPLRASDEARYVGIVPQIRKRALGRRANLRAPWRLGRRGGNSMASIEWQIAAPLLTFVQAGQIFFE